MAVADFNTGPILLAQVGHDLLTNFEFVLQAPWRCCRLCGAVYQHPADRQAYIEQQNGNMFLARLMEDENKRRRDRWERIHNRRYHPNYDKEVAQLHKSGMAFTPEAAHKLAPFGIVHVGPTTYEDEIADALFEAPRAPRNDSED